MAGEGEGGENKEAGKDTISTTDFANASILGGCAISPMFYKLAFAINVLIN